MAVLRQDPEAHSGVRGLLLIRVLLCCSWPLRSVRLGGLTDMVLCVGRSDPCAALRGVRVREISVHQIDQNIQPDTHSQRADFLRRTWTSRDGGRVTTLASHLQVDRDLIDKIRDPCGLGAHKL